MSANLGATQMSTNSSPAAVGGNVYFTDQKKGELNELKQALKNINLDKDPNRKRETIKKVIAYMTLGIDVSRLLTEMIMAIETKDIVVKKMVYFYLCNYAHKEPELAIMCINTLRRDCDNDDPMVRGLALRSLCGLRLESILEYVQQPLLKSLTDVSPYVRKTGVMGILKIFHLSPQTVETNDSITQLYRMLLDTDANVITNVIYVLNEILIDKGGIEITQNFILSLLNRISEFSEWGLANILDMVSRYAPQSEEETFSIMNLLDPVLRTASSGAVISTFKCFMKFSVLFPELQPQVFLRSKPPILTLITGTNPEVQYAVLKHLQIMLERHSAKHVFDDEYRQFYVRYNEPPYVKHLKVDILPLLGNSVNAKDIAMELNEYVTDVDSELSKRAIIAIAEIGMRIPSVAGEMTSNLVNLMDLEMSYVRSESMKNIVNLLRIYPQGKVYILPSLSRFFKRITASNDSSHNSSNELSDNEAKAALIWILGEYGTEVIEAPYIIEPLIDNYEDENSSLIKLHLLSAAMKLFFKRPPEVQKMLGKLLKLGINDTSNHDVHDRSLLYYRLLQTGAGNISSMKSLFLGLSEQSMMFGVVATNNAGNTNSFGKGYAELRDLEKKSQIFNEFNTLAVIYELPSQKFIQKQYQTSFEVATIPDYDPASAIDSTTNNIDHSVAPVIAAAPQSSQPTVNSNNLLDLDDPIQPSPVFAAAPSVLTLKGSVDISPQQYQAHWLSLPEVFNGRIFCLQTVPKSIVELESLLKQHALLTMASGPLPASSPLDSTSGFKFFLLAAENDNYLTGEVGALFLVQLVLMLKTGEVSITLKTTSIRSNASLQFLELLTTIFRPLGLTP